MGATLAYNIALSLAPTVLTLLSIAGLAFGTQAAEGRLVSQIQVLVLASGLFLETSLIVNAWISAAGTYLNAGAAPPEALVQATDWVVSFVVITLLFAFIFKVLPRVALHWSDVTLGAIGTSLVFVAGKSLLGVYLGKAGLTDLYGAAGSLVIILVWVYYSAQVLFLGAEFTRAYACRFGSMCKPNR